MRSFLNTLLGWLGRTPPRLRCRRQIWDAGVQQLAKRTLGGRRESGAYLLGRPRSDGSRTFLNLFSTTISDEEALATGIVTIRQTALPRLLGSFAVRAVTASSPDVHVHPYGLRPKAESDQANPSHAAHRPYRAILPEFAHGNPRPGSIGMYEFLGNETWDEHSAKGGSLLPA